MNANAVAASTLAVVGVLVLGVGTFGLSVLRPTYSLPSAQVQLVLDPTCYYNQCVVTQQPTASPSSFAATADAIGIVESPFVVQSYSVGVGTAVQNCGFGSGTIDTPTTVTYPPTYSVFVNGQKVGTLPQFFGANTVCGRTGIANFGYNYQPFWLNFTGCGANGCGVVQFAVGYAPVMSAVPICYPSIMGAYPGATATNGAGCAQSQPAASYYAPLATTSTTSTTSTTQAQTQTITTTATVTTAFTYTAAGTTTTMQVTVTTTQAAPSSAKSSVQALGIGMLILGGVVLYFGREEEADS